MSNRSFLTLRVEGMTCKSCARHVTQALKTVPGVEDVQVGAWRVGLATVVTGPDVTDRALLEAVQRSGYHGVIVERRPLEPTRLVPVSKGR
ncbi:MAG: heavy-metal-associated domain-containing protein, partial [Nitrospiraceae bacterium]|nr:heavy-metal-associated domain-containing protein [Nitrospiraceae bacterium]